MLACCPFGVQVTKHRGCRPASQSRGEVYLEVFDVLYGLSPRRWCASAQNISTTLTSCALFYPLRIASVAQTSALSLKSTSATGSIQGHVTDSKNNPVVGVAVFSGGGSGK